MAGAHNGTNSHTLNHATGIEVPLPNTMLVYRYDQCLIIDYLRYLPRSTSSNKPWIQQNHEFMLDDWITITSPLKFLQKSHCSKFTSRASAGASSIIIGRRTQRIHYPFIPAFSGGLAEESLPETNNPEQKLWTSAPRVRSGHMFSHPTIPIRSMCGAHQFNANGRPVTGTPLASISSFCQAHQQMHLPGHHLSVLRCVTSSVCTSLKIVFLHPPTVEFDMNIAHFR